MLTAVIITGIVLLSAFRFSVTCWNHNMGTDYNSQHPKPLLEVHPLHM